MMEILTIELTFRMEDFRNLYYSGDRKSIFHWRNTQKSMLATGYFAAFSALAYLMAQNHAGWVFVFIIAILITAGSLVFFLLNTYKYYQWKGGVENYLKKQSQYPSQTLVLTNTTIELTSPEGTFIDKWESIKNVVIDKNHIMLKGNEPIQYLFPVQAMNISDYEQLKEFVGQRMRN